MKVYATSAVLALLSFTVLALPSPKAGVPVSVEAIGRDVTPTPPRSNRVLARDNTLCKVVNTNYWAHCRSGPSLDHAATYFIFTNIDYEFTCYVGTAPQCVDGNCTWDKLVWDGGSCYVSGYYTDDRCTVARLGAC